MTSAKQRSNSDADETGALVVENVVLPIAADAPADWQGKVSAVATKNDLEAFNVVSVPGRVTLSLRARAAIGSDKQHFDSAVETTCDEVEGLLSPPAPTYEERLKAAASRAATGTPTDITGRELLGWFGAARRGTRVVEHIRAELDRHGLVTDPDFNDVWVDVPLKLKVVPRPTGPVAVPSAGPALVAAVTPKAAPPTDPVHRVGRLAAANQPVVHVPPGTTVEVAATTMMLRDFSQLPVMRSERECKGAVSWQSVGLARALAQSCANVDDCLVPVEEVSADTSLLHAIPKIVSQGFVLVRGRDRKFQGIVTVSDLSLQFRLLSEPFLLLGQIENHVRALVRRSFSIDEVRAAKNPTDTARVVNDAADLTFGEYVRLLEPIATWPKLRVSFARDPFLGDLREVVTIRNDVMHFDPEPLEDAQMILLRNFSGFLERAVGT